MIDKSKFQISNFKFQNFWSLIFFVWILLGIWDLGFGISPLHAKEIVLLYTGETHAMLYPCSCPKESDGGVARRATLVKKLKTEYSDALLLDSGSFFAGGLSDEYTQNTELDNRRTIVNLKAMDMMNYDAGTIGDNEFSFGKDFFLKNINDTNLTFLSCNISGSQQLAAIKSIKPYIVKEVSGIKIGIIGVTNLAANTKSGELKFSEPTPSVAKYVTELKNNGVNIIVLVSQLEESEDLNLINQIKGIDILMGSRHPARDKSYVKLENTLILKPFWQGRSLGKVTLTVENNKIISFKVEAFRLSDQISDDADILTILPRCFSDANCKREGVVGACQQPGTLNASCLFSKPNKIDTLVITSKTCITCNTATAVNFLKNKLPGLNLIYLYYPEKKAADLLKSLGISGLPAYLLSKEIEKEKNFDSLRLNLEQKGNFYLVKPQVSGISYFFNRNKTKGSLDLFISLYDKNSSALLDVIKEFKPAIHFLASEKEGKFDAMKEEPEVEEYLRAVCVQKYYPEKFWDYIYCRTKDIFSSWWDECALDLDTNKIKSCAKGTEGISLLRENITINKELDIILGPTYLLDNQEIFGSNGVPTKEELKAIIKR